LRARPVPLGTAVAVVTAALWMAGVGAAWVVDEHAPRGRSELVQSLDSLAWPAATQPAPVSARAPAASSGSGVQAGSVESLVGGLEARLAAQPNDANGWALLAQSYAYTANEEAVERAVRRAVELGVDERSLRERIATAKRSAHPVDWVEQALSVPR
jgi:cytochrome c-type biogenesis protein CcmH